MTSDNDKPTPPTVTMKKIDPDTGEEIPSTPEEQAEALREMRAMIRAGKIEFTDEVKEQLGLKGLTPEVIESWLAEKDSD